MALMTRNAQRQHLDQGTRVILIEQDLDVHERVAERAMNDLNAKADRAIANSERTNKILVGLLITLVSGILVYAAQLLIGAAARSNAGG